MTRERSEPIYRKAMASSTENPLERKREDEALTKYLLTRLAAGIDPKEHRLRGEAGLLQMAERGVEFVCQRKPGEIRVEVSNSQISGSERTLVQVLLLDQPFLVDSFRLNLRRLGLIEKLLLHPSLVIEREEDGLPAVIGVGTAREAYLYAEVALIPEAERRAEYAEELRRTFGQIRDVVADHGAMLKALRAHTAGLDKAESSEISVRTRELMDFLYWLAADNFVFLGYRRYDVEKTPQDLRVVADAESGLGSLRSPAPSRFSSPCVGEQVPELIRKRLADERRVFFDKSNTESVVHRAGRVDTVSIKLFDDQGELIGFGKFVGLLTYQAVRSRPSEIPIIRRRREHVLESIAAERGSHTYKAAIEAFDSLPLEFLFSFEIPHVIEAILGTLRAYEGRSVEVVVIPDLLNRSFFLSVILPRALYRENLRSDLRRLLVDRYRVSYLDHRITFVDDDCALIHFFCSFGDDIDPGVLDLLERDVERCALRWEDRFEASLLEQHSEDEGYRLASEYADAFPGEYRVLTEPEAAIHDIQHLERVRLGLSSVELAFSPIEQDGDGGTAVLKIYQRERPYLTDLLPLLDHFGLRSRDAKLTEVRCGSGERMWIGAFEVERDNRSGELLRDREKRVVEGLRAVLRGAMEADALNSLIFGVGFEWKQVDLFRAYFAYAAQLGIGLRPSVVAEILLRYPETTRCIWRLFAARFDPELQGDRAPLEQSALRRLAEEREPIPTADEDKIFAMLEELIRCTMRTSYYIDPNGHDLLVFKIDSKRLSFAPHPRPFMEMFVQSVQMSGVHLRGGPIARGGLRWSDRIQDFRQEVLGLMKTQMVKNGLIVPVGAKGGFVLRQRFDDRQAARSAADHQYARFVGALLTLTDNMHDGAVTPPPRVVRQDGDDPYLVVAPDKGTAHLSDTANRVAQSFEFWLGDAFASGGSDGYDHKAEGITARGAWICVRRHFLELGIDIESETFTMAGIGDMSGDVFGNGLLLARNARLLAAFNHEHVFLDPDPDPAVAWQERKRLFELERSSWRDYDVAKISEGGGVFERSAKSIPLSPRVREMLGLSDDALSGEKLVRSILKMTVDLLWNGGIGTYVKSSAESDADVGDRANDSVRVNGRDLRARVIGEGGNLGFTQLARVEYALSGGRINTDAVDNSGGVDLSDLEVNFKILLSGSVQKRRMTHTERNVLLRDCAGQADAYVIAHNESQSHGVSMDLIRCRETPERMVLAARYLERNAGLDLSLEFLPTREELRGRARPGSPNGYTRPELAVLLGYSKLLAKRELTQAELITHPSFLPVLEAYFPDRLRECFANEIHEHPLRREITATVLSNRVLDRAGVTLLPELTRTLAATVPEIIAAYYMVNHMLEAEHLRWAIERQDVPEELRLHASRRVESAVRWGTRTRLGLERRVLLEPGELAHWTGLVRRLRGVVNEGANGDVSESERAKIRVRAERLVERGLDPELANEIEQLPFVVRSLGVVSIAIRADVALPIAVRLHTEVGQVTRVSWLLDRLGDLERRGGWDRVAAEALVLELLETQRRITARLLEGTGEQAPFEHLCHDQATALQTIAEAAQEIEAEERRGLAPLAVLSQMIRRLC